MDRPSSASATWACGYVVAARARALCAPSHWARASSGLEQWNHAKASASDAGRPWSRAASGSRSAQSARSPSSARRDARARCAPRARGEYQRETSSRRVRWKSRGREQAGRSARWEARNAACPPRNPAPSSCGPPRGNAGLSARSPKQGPLRFPFLDRENVSTRSVLHLRICPACVSRTLDGDEFPNKSRVLTEPSARLTRPPERTSVLL